MTNTILADTVNGMDCFNVSGATIATNINNLIEDGACTPALSGDPQLGPLQDNGGPTFTHMPAASSPVIDAGTNTGAPVTDQRGVSRPVDGDNDGTPTCDIGAVEFKTEINLKQGATAIPVGGSYDFGNHAAGTETDIVFTIENSEKSELALSGTPIIKITGTDFDQFSVEIQPVSPVAPDATTPFKIRFSPTSAGAKTASIAIANNDNDENPYNLNLNAVGTAGALAVLTVSPDTADLRPGQEHQFSVAGVDAYGNSVDVGTIVWSGAAGIGSIDPTSGFFTATIAGQGTVTATSSIGSVTDDSGTITVSATLPSPDSDGDGISDELEDKGDRDRDGDGIDNCHDYDPTGYLYDSATGEIISGGSISVSGSGSVNFISGRNGSDGYYQFVVGQVGTYTISVTPPAGYSVDSAGCPDSGTLTASGVPNPLVLGSGEYGATGHLADYSCDVNKWYLIIDIQTTTPLILNNNIPLVNNASIPTLNEWGMVILSCLLALVVLSGLRRREGGVEG